MLWSGLVATRAGAVPPNDPPVVSAGANQVVVSAVVALEGSVSDDGRPDPPGVVGAGWTQLSGPGPVVFADPAAVDTTATLPAWGTYVLRLDADDGDASSHAEVAITFVDSSTDVRAFPGAEGFGAWAVGGRGGRVIEVTTLADSGPGSLREAVDASGPRIVVFRTSGIIWLASGLRLQNPYLTVAGHTAPGDGITLANGASVDTVLKVETHDVVLRHLRIRPGPGGDPDGISIERAVAHDVIVDHCSLTWGVDENISTYADVHDVTLQWSLIAESLDCSTHPEGCHGKGMIAGGDGGRGLSVHHNLFAHNAERSPRVSADGVVDVVNNVVYNPRFTGGWGPSHVKSGIGAVIRVNYVGNYYAPGVDSGSADWYVSSSDVHEIHLDANLVPGEVIRPSDASNVVALRHPAPLVTTTAAPVAYGQVLADVGASRGLACDGTSLARRDPVDARIVADVLAGTGMIIDDPAQVGGYPAPAAGTPCRDADNDGLPDLYEMLSGLDPEDPDDASADPDGDGYTSLDRYLGFAGPIATPTAVPALPPGGPALLAGLLLSACLGLRRGFSKRALALRQASRASLGFPAAPPMESAARCGRAGDPAP